MTNDCPNKPNGVTILCNIYFENLGVMKRHTFLNKFIIQLTKKLGLQPLLDSLYTKHFKEDNPVGEGITSTMILMTSHVCYHTWENERYMRLELSVCKTVIEYDVVTFIYEYFGNENIKFVSHEIRKW